jgi:HSP20 family molecular chaperone IbpA
MTQCADKTGAKNGNLCGTRERFLVPRTDVVESRDGIELIADLPGVDQKNVDIGVEKQTLTISAKISDFPENGAKFARRELAEGRYRRVFELPEGIDSSRIEASMKDGVLHLSLPKAEQHKPRKIEVRAS